MNIILACDKNYGIGIDNNLPSWNLKEDMFRFKRLTIGKGNNIIIMGKNTYLSLNKRSLKRRFNIIVSKSLFEELNILKYIPYEGFYIFDKLEEAYNFATYLVKDNNGKIWAIGGAQLYESCVESCKIDSAYITIIDKEYNCDVYLKDKTIKFIKDRKWDKIQDKSNDFFSYRFYDYKRSN